MIPRILWLLVLGTVLLGGWIGCARRAKVQPPPTTEITAGPKPERGEPGPVDEEGIRLPGQDRYLPSEDPRNRSQVATAVAHPVVQKPEVEASPRPGAPPDTLVLRTVTKSPPIHPAAPSPPPSLPTGEARFRVQLFVSASSQTAHSFARQVASKTKERVSVEQEGAVWKVRVGEPMTRSEAGALRRRMNDMGYHDAFVLEVHPQ